jgi:hypothetical protein
MQIPDFAGTGAPQSSGGLLGSLERILAVGIPAYVDLQAGRRYTPNDPTPNTASTSGIGSPAGQAGGLGAIQNAFAAVPPWVWMLAAGGLVAVLVLRKR